MRSRSNRRTAWPVCVITLVIAGVTLGAAPSVTGGAAQKLGQGVTKDSVKVGIAVIDYDAIKDFVDFNHGDQLKIAKILVDYINKNGGVGGRKIIPVIKTYPPIPGRQPSPLSLCTSWAEDDKVFAVLGVFIDFTGQGQLCLAREHHVIHIGHELDQPWIDQSPAGLMVTPNQTKEEAASVLLTLLSTTGRLKGKTVAVLGDKTSEPRVNNIVVPGLKKDKVKTGSTGILTLTGTDTTAAQAQLDSFIEKWKGEHVNAVFLAGLNVATKQFAESIKASLPKAQLYTDADQAVQQARDEVKAGKNPNPFEGMLSTTGQSASEAWAHKNATMQKCVDIYEKETGEKVPDPDHNKTDSAGKKIQLDVGIADFCSDLFMFRDIATKVGPNLTTANWQKAVDTFGTIVVAGNRLSSLCKGKYAANDAFRLVSFDPTAGGTGDWKAVTPVKDGSGGKCTKAAG